MEKVRTPENSLYVLKNRIHLFGILLIGGLFGAVFFMIMLISQQTAQKNYLYDKTTGVITNINKYNKMYITEEQLYEVADQGISTLFNTDFKTIENTFSNYGVLFSESFLSNYKGYNKKFISTVINNQLAIYIAPLNNIYKAENLKNNKYKVTRNYAYEELSLTTRIIKEKKFEITLEKTNEKAYPLGIKIIDIKEI